MKKIAVLIPSFKPGSYLVNCLASLSNQTISKDSFCVYIALNGPQYPYEDFIISILESNKFNYTYIYLEKSGVSRARNKLLDISDEEYVVFVDDDDQLSENYLENLIDASSEKYIGISNTFNFEDDLDNLKNNFIGESFFLLENVERSKYKARKYFSSPWAKMIHRSMIKKFRFDTELANGEDSLFMAEISKNVVGLKKTSSDTCYFVFERSESASRKKVKLISEIKRVYYLLSKYLILFFKKGYDRFFILTRIAATLKQLSRIF